ncbi:hypothetical protein Ccrd_005292, partial [Cynara cardunculus var. scolymus]
KENAPRTVKDVKLISAGKILENNKTVGECRSPLCDVPGGVTTMHVIVSQPPQEKGKLFVPKTYKSKKRPEAAQMRVRYIMRSNSKRVVFADKMMQDLVYMFMNGWQ